ncbi:response regulator [Rhizobium sp. TH2]|uniref:response regulator transcription factor n=1 Tax=Rhizobium sp. TH2 TaxID=2775403 RepID=UPI002157CC5B|nr:response regulator [Rhizobium sp. TH2]UVC09597.1 response regulator [Rhizobium sp. TH2]
MDTIREVDGFDCVGRGGRALENLKGKIAVIDDDLGIRTSVERLLKLNGFEVDAYASPELFLCQDYTDVYACLVLDVHFDGMSGLDLRKFLLKSKPNIPIVFISAEDADQIPELPADHAFLHKPFSGSLLIKTIRSVVAS